MICGKLSTELSKLQLLSIDLKKFNNPSPMSKDRTKIRPLTTEYILLQKWKNQIFIFVWYLQHMVNFTKLLTAVICWVSKVYQVIICWKQCTGNKLEVVNKSIVDFSLSILVIGELIDNFIYLLIICCLVYSLRKCFLSNPIMFFTLLPVHKVKI